MKRRSLFVPIALAFLALVLCGPSTQADAKKITLKLVTAWPPDHFNSKPVLDLWMNKINERAKGELEIKHVGGPEVMKYEDFVTLGSEAACKDQGKLAVEGKNYTVQDADILHIRFNV